jgi:hypothetical protein
MGADVPVSRYSQTLRLLLVVSALAYGAPIARAWAENGGAGPRGGLGGEGVGDGVSAGGGPAGPSVSVTGGGGNAAASVGVSTNGASGGGNAPAGASVSGSGFGGSSAGGSSVSGGGNWGGGSAGSAGGSGSGGSGSTPFGAFWNNLRDPSGAGDGPGKAQSERRSELKSEQRLARDAVSRGLIQPLDAILPKVQEKVPGSLLSVRLRRDESGAWIYGLVILSPDGKYRRVLVDAAENRILQAK